MDPARIEELSLPEGLEVMTQGYSSAPIIQCPRPAKKYVDMLQQLQSLQSRIQSEACRQSEDIEQIKDGVSDLKSLVTDQRVTFVELVKKGTSVGGQLSDEEIDLVENYIDQVVKKASVVTGFLNNEACFDEPAKFSALGTLSSVIGEVSGAVGALAGPFGAKISLAGSVVSGLLGSLNTIVQARTSYDPEVQEDRLNYLNTLCAYYDFKADFDKETKTLKYDRRLRKTSAAAGALIEGLVENCDECRVAIQDFRQRFTNNQTFAIDRARNGSVFGAGDDNYVEILQAKELNEADLMYRYFDFVEPSVNQSPNFLTPETPISRSTKKQQEATATALLIQAWADTELDKLRYGEDLGAADELREPITTSQNKIEDVLFKSVAADYVNYHRKKLQKAYKNLSRASGHVISQLYSFRPKRDPKFRASDFQERTIVVAFHELFRLDLEFIDSPNPLLQNDLDYMLDWIDTYGSQLIDQFDALRKQYALLEQRCHFYETSSYEMRRSSGLSRACQASNALLQEVSATMNEVQQTSFGVEFPFYFKTFVQEDRLMAADWLESVTLHMALQAEAL